MENTIFSFIFDDGQEQIRFSNTFSSINSQFNSLNFASVVCTNIKKDGAMKGIDLDFIIKNVNIFSKPFIVSGGVTSLNDLKVLKNNEKKGIEGVICGRALYEGKIDLVEANKIFKKDWYVKN